MSYSILIKAKEKDTVEVLFSTKLFYENYWLELSSKLNLCIISEFQYGVEIGYNELKELLDELSVVEKYLISKESNSENESNILKRIEYIKEEINKINFDKIKLQEIFIG